jgi:hypothetical protein
MARDDEDNPALPIERRDEVRGVFPGLKLTIGAKTFEVLNASRKSFLAVTTETAGYAKGDRLQARIVLARNAVDLEVSVVRIADEGVVFRVARVDADGQSTLDRLLGAASEDENAARLSKTLARRRR